MRALLPVAFLFAAGCATHEQSLPTPGQRWDALHEFQHLQGVFRAQYSGHHEFDFPDHGRVTVREISLDGFPGHTYVRCRFHYQNRTPKPVVQSWVSLDVLDADGKVVATDSVNLVMWTSSAIDRGSYYAEELRTQTHGAHLREGWSWRIRCHARQEQTDEPLDPPVQEYQGRPWSAPMWIQDPDWAEYQWRAQMLQGLHNQASAADANRAQALRNLESR
jgi:hypothetical protein